MADVPESITRLEERIDKLRGQVRAAALTGDRAAVRSFRAELRRAEADWDDALADIEDAAPKTPTDRTTAKPASEPLLPVREQVHRVLTLLGVPTAPKLIVGVHEALFGGEIVGARLTSLRRDEQRSFEAAPYSRPYYICSALAAEMLNASRGLLAVSTWTLADRIIGPLSPRTDFLTSAIRIAEHVDRLEAPGTNALRLLWRFAANIPGAADAFASMKPAVVVRAAEAELEVHRDRDRDQRESAARRAKVQLNDVELLFGGRFGSVPEVKPA